MLFDRMIKSRMVTKCSSFLIGEVMLLYYNFHKSYCLLLHVISLQMIAVPYSIVPSGTSMKSPSKEHSSCWLIG
jgi:hypothetical protein